ncbi:hypothetical protein ITI46_20980 [Streptomyces oryzae]|uniref:Tetratricopeptide repeat protein n=1 Tax=Streptomyces oryzae TaxID=1434886 RepID=A0ABS3XFE0_9ACTN|nr:hypothetical protein [Streptomyces oryzae]
MHIPLTLSAGADVPAGAKADAFRHAAEVVTGVLGPATLLGCWGDRAPFDTTPPAWGGPFRRWQRPDRPNCLELSAGEDGPELVLQPKDPAEYWLEELGEAARPITAFLAISRDDPTNDGLGFPGFSTTEDWDEFSDALGTFLATLPTVTRALGVELSIPMHAAIPGTSGPITFHLACGDQLELALYENRCLLTDDALTRLGWLKETTLPSACDHLYDGAELVSHHSAAYGPGAPGASSLGDLLVDTAKAFGIKAPTGLNPHYSADDLGGYRARFYALPHGGYRYADDDVPPPPRAPKVDHEQQLTIAAQAYGAGEDDVAAQALARTAGVMAADTAQRALEAAQRYALARAASGDHVGALRYAEVTLRLPVETGPAELRNADRLRATGASPGARHVYEQLADHPAFALRLLARGRLLASAREAGDKPTARALLEGRLGDIQWHADRPTALRTLRSAAETGVPIALFDLGKRLLHDDEIDEARTVFHRVTELDTGLTCRALFKIGETHARQNDHVGAHTWYLHALEAPGEPDTAALAAVNGTLGGTAKAARDLPEARRRFRAVLDTGDPAHRPWAAAHLAEIAYWTGEHDTAARYYELTLATGTRDPELVGEASYRLAEIRRDAGDFELAERCLLRAADSGHPDFTQQARTLLDTLR